jgi:hypothetical protein
MSMFISAAKDQLKELWKSCYVGDDILTTFEKVVATKAGNEEDILAHYEAQLAYWTRYLDENRVIIAKVSKD